VRFFFDNCMSSNLTEAMRLLNRPHHEIEHLTDRFSPDVQDTDWLPAVAPDKDLILVSADPAITSGRKEREVWLRTGLTAFFFGGGFADKGFWPQTLEVVRWWPEIVTAARETTAKGERGTGYLLPLGGRGKPRPLYAPFRGAP